MDDAKLEARQTAMQNMRLKDDTARAQQNSQDLLVENARSAWSLFTDCLHQASDFAKVHRRDAAVSVRACSTAVCPTTPRLHVAGVHKRTAERASHCAASAAAAMTCGLSMP